MTNPSHKSGMPGNTTALPNRPHPPVLAIFADGAEIQAIGLKAATLLRLIENGPRGVRAFDFSGGLAYRLSAYIHDLRRKGISIRSDFEQHMTGSYAVYVLESRIAILNVCERASHE